MSGRTETAKQKLSNAASYIARNGWFDGNTCEERKPGRERPACMYNALHWANGDDIEDALKLLRKVLRVRDNRGIFAWNDGQTKKQAIAKLRQAAK